MSAVVSPKSTTTRSNLQNLNSITSVRSRETNIFHINPNEGNTEEGLLAQIGYKQELTRTMSGIGCFGIAYSIMGLLPSIVTLMGTGLTAGPVGLVWGWFFSSLLILFGIGWPMAELASAVPSSGGMYLWTYIYAPEGLRNALSYMVGFVNSFALCGSVCSITYGLAVQIMSCVYIAYDGDYNITTGAKYGVFAGCIALQLLCSCLTSRGISNLQTTSIVCNNILILIFFIVLPIGTAKNGQFNDAKYIFGDFENFSPWADGWAFLQYGFLPAAWTIGAFDSCVHMAEEVKNPVKNVPYGIVGSIGACGIMGTLICIVIAACLPADIDSIINTPSGQPLTQMFYNVLGKKWAIAFMSLCALCQFLMGASVMVAISRQIWAFARDDGLPLSRVLKIVDKKIKVPVYATIASGIVSLVVGLLTLIGDGQASNALFALSVIGSYIAYAAPQVLRMTVGRDKFTPGPFYAGLLKSNILNIMGICYMFLVFVLFCFPTSNPVDKDTMNYSVVLVMGAYIIAGIYYMVYKKRDYKGPKSNLTDAEYEELVIDGIENNIDTIVEEAKASMW